MSKRILILLHETDPFPSGPSRFIWGLRNAWLEMGLEVRVAKGLDALEPADLVIPHVDLTVTPTAYRAALEGMPNVVNRGVYDISKRRVSANLLGPDDPYRGPVIVKTDRNYGGIPELVLAQAQMRRLERLLALVPQGPRRPPLPPAKPNLFRGTDYPIFDSLAEVPAQAFLDPNLVVERFLPEREGQTFFLRWYCFIGDRFRSMRVGSPNPLVKLSGMTSLEKGVPVPAEVVAFREKWNLDFGRIDFVIHQGQPIILDVNRTTSDEPPPKLYDSCRCYGPGVLPLLERQSGATGPLLHQDVDT
jgi:hypothetical protein